MNSKLTKLMSLMLVVVMVLGMFAGCGQTAEPAATEATAAPAETQAPAAPAASADTLVYANDYMSQKFSPFFADTQYDQDAAALTQVTLLPSDREGNVVLNAKDGAVVPYNGTDYTYNGAANCVITENADGTVTYAIEMRNDIVFSDGTPATIDDVIFSMYVLCDPTYDGSSTLYSQKILGMEAYRSGMDSLQNLLVAAGRDNTDFTNWDEATQTAFWADLDQAGAQFAQEIVDYCIAAGYGSNVSEGAAAWGFGGLAADATAADFFNMMFDAYEGDLASMNSVESAGTSLFDFMENAAAYTVGISTGAGAANIEGIVKTGDYTMEVTLEGIDPTFIYQLTLYVSPLHYYGDAAAYDYENNQFGFTKGDLSGVRAKTTKPLGAGPYKYVSYENNILSMEANENYYLGMPKIKNLKLQGVSSADKLTGMTTDLFDVTVPNFNDDDIAAIKAANSNSELSGDKLTTMAVDNLGYGYIGINADNVKVGDDKASEESKALRRGLATLMSVFREPVVYAYYGDRASIIQYPISNTSWAAPKPADEGYNLAYSKDAAGNVVVTADMTQEEKVVAAKAAAKSLFEAAGYVFGADGKVTTVPAGGATEWEVIIPANGVGDHPAYGILTETKNALNEIGMDLIINDPADSNELWDALDAGTAEMWAAAWSSTADPDMYQIYHSSNVHGLEGSSNSNHYGIQAEELDALIMEGRTSTDQAFRKATYKTALEVIMDWGVELPTYQRQNATLFSTERVNVATIPGDLTPFYGWMAEIHTLELN